jgi:multidrug resistance efflux pump
MKFNILYILWLAAIGLCLELKNVFMGQSSYTFFGTAETEGRVINCEYPVLIEKVYVKTGNMVKVGDTLAICFRSEIDKQSMNKLGEIETFQVENSAKNSLLDKDLEVLKVRHTARLADLQSQINLIQTEENIQANIKELIGEKSNNQLPSNSLKTAKIAAIEDEIRQMEHQFQEQCSQIETQRTAQKWVSNTKIAQVKKEMSLLKHERERLILLSPINGFVENVSIVKNEIIPQYKELFKLNPKSSNRIRGFIHETANVVYALGDTVKLTSSARPNVVSKGILIGSNPQLVELPTRLRKVPELRTWGREIFIQIPDTTHFFIGEKIVIAVASASAEPVSNAFRR